MNNEGAYQNLERIKEETIKHIEEMSNIRLDKYFEDMNVLSLIGRNLNQKKIKDAAIKEIRVNFISAKRYLKEITEGQLEVKDNLEGVRELYDKNEFYRNKMNHLEKHFEAIKQIARDIKSQEFIPRLVEIKLEEVLQWI